MAYKRRIYLINPRFQLRFSFYVCLFMFICSIIYPVTIYDLMSKFITFAEQAVPGSSSTLLEKRQSLIVVLGLWQLGITVVTFIVCIFFSHKIAGPLYKLQKFLTGVRDGHDYGRLFFRNGDYFQELAEDYNDAFERIKEDYKNDFVYLSEVSGYLKNLSMVVPDDKKAVLSEINKRLEDIQSKFQEKE